MELFNIMKDRNPEFANALLEKLKSAGDEPVAVLDRGFITVAEDVVGEFDLEDMEQNDNE